MGKVKMLYMQLNEDYDRELPYRRVSGGDSLYVKVCNILIDNGFDESEARTIAADLIRKDRSAAIISARETSP